MKYLAMEIACHECGMGTHECFGIFDTEAEAEAALEGRKPNYFSNIFEVVEFEEGKQ